MSGEQKPKIFIGHRFADKPIADVINIHLARWGFDEDDIYQAGAPGAGPRVEGPHQIAEATMRMLQVLVRAEGSHSFSQLGHQRRSLEKLGTGDTKISWCQVPLRPWYTYGSLGWHPLLKNNKGDQGKEWMHL
jgi:hypothetical protein